MDRGRDHRGGVVRVDHLHALRHERFQVGDGLADRLGGIQRVGAGGQLDRDTGRRAAVELRVDAVVLAAQAYIGDVLQAHLGTVGIDLEQDVLELLRGLQAGLADDGGVELLALDRRQATELAGGNLHVLRLDRAAHVAGGQLVAVQLGRVEPDAHRVLRAEHLEVTDALGPRERVLDVGNDVVRQVFLGHAAVGGNHTDHHEEVLHRLGHPDPLALHFLRQ